MHISSKRKQVYQRAFLFAMPTLNFCAGEQNFQIDTAEYKIREQPLELLGLNLEKSVRIGCVVA